MLAVLGQDRVDGDDRNTRRHRLIDRGHDAVHVDGDNGNAVNAFLDIGLDGAVLGGRVIVGVEDHQLHPGRIRRLLRACIHLIEEQRLLVDLDKGELLFVLSQTRHCRQHDG